MIKWEDPLGPPVGPEHIAALERELGIRFPAAFVALVQVGDAARPASEDLWATAPDGRHQVIDVLTRLESLGDGGLIRSHQALVEMGENNGVDLRAMIPFGDNGDGWICFDYRGSLDSNDPPIVSWTMTPLEGADHDGAVPIAASFTEMLKMLEVGA